MDGCNPTVFLVDDDLSVVRAMSRSLRRRGLTVKPYSSGKAFLDSYNGQYGCLVLDLYMPEMTGLELQNELSKSEFDLPIIFISGHGGASESVQALNAGAMAFLEKPFSPDILLQKINEATQLSQNINLAAAEAY